MAMHNQSAAERHERVAAGREGNRDSQAAAKEVRSMTPLPLRQLLRR